MAGVAAGGLGGVAGGSAGDGGGGGGGPCPSSWVGPTALSVTAPPPRISLWAKMTFTNGIIALGHFWYTNFWVPDQTCH